MKDGKSITLTILGAVKNHSRQYGWVEKVHPESYDSFDQYRGGVQELNGYT